MTYYTVSSIANEFRCSEKTIRRIIKLLDIAVQGKNGNTNLYSEEDLPKIQQQLAKNQINQGSNSETGKIAVKEVLSANLPTSNNISVTDLDLITKIVTEAVKGTVTQLIPVIVGQINPQNKVAEIPAPKMDSRAHVTQLVRNYAQAARMPYQDVYTMLYTEYGYRTHSNPSQCALNRSMKIIDYIESAGQMPQLEALAVEYLIPPKVYKKDWLAE